MPKKKPPQEKRCGHCNSRVLPPEARAWADNLSVNQRLKYGPVAYELGDDLVCPECYGRAERLARYERLKRRREAEARDPRTVRYVDCAGEGCEATLLAPCEAHWAGRLGPEARSVLPPHPVYDHGRPYCEACYAKRHPPEPAERKIDPRAPAWADVETELGA